MHSTANIKSYKLNEIRIGFLSANACYKSIAQTLYDQIYLGEYAYLGSHPNKSVNKSDFCIFVQGNK